MNERVSGEEGRGNERRDDLALTRDEGEVGTERCSRRRLKAW